MSEPRVGWDYRRSDEILGGTDPGRGAALVGWRQGAEGAEGRSVRDALVERLSAADFGAKGDGSHDDTVALQRAVRAAIESSRALYLPPGTYLVTAPLVVNPDTANAQAGFAIVGEPGTPRYNQPTMPSRIAAGYGFPADSPILDVRHTRQSCIRDLGLIGLGAATAVYGIELGARTGATTFTNHEIRACTIHNCYDGVRARNAGLSRILFCNISGSTRAGIAFREWCGDSQIAGNLINTINNTFTGADLWTGAGILLASGCGNTTVTGGKIEWCAKGILIDGCSGVNIGDVQFDSNRFYHVGIAPEGAGALEAQAIGLSNCQFLAGGTVSSGDWGKAAISMVVGAGRTASARVSGCSFHRGGDYAYPFNAGPNQGPDDAAIKIRGAGTTRLIFSGCDMTDCSDRYTIDASGPASLYDGGNIETMPNNLASGATVVTLGAWA